MNRGTPRQVPDGLFYAAVNRGHLRCRNSRMVPSELTAENILDLMAGGSRVWRIRGLPVANRTEMRLRPPKCKRKKTGDAR